MDELTRIVEFLANLPKCVRRIIDGDRCTTWLGVGFGNRSVEAQIIEGGQYSRTVRDIVSCMVPLSDHLLHIESYIEV